MVFEGHCAAQGSKARFVHLTLMISTGNNATAFNLSPILVANNPPAQKAIEGRKDESKKDDATASRAQKQVSSPKESVRMPSRSSNPVPSDGRSWVVDRQDHCPQFPLSTSMTTPVSRSLRWQVPWGSRWQSRVSAAWLSELLGNQNPNLTLLSIYVDTNPKLAEAEQRERMQVNSIHISYKVRRVSNDCQYQSLKLSQQFDFYSFLGRNWRTSARSKPWHIGIDLMLIDGNVNMASAYGKCTEKYRDTAIIIWVGCTESMYRERSLLLCSLSVESWLALFFSKAQTKASCQLSRIASRLLLAWAYPFQLHLVVVVLPHQRVKKAPKAKKGQSKRQTSIAGSWRRYSALLEVRLSDILHVSFLYS